MIEERMAMKNEDNDTFSDRDMFILDRLLDNEENGCVF